MELSHAVSDAFSIYLGYLRWCEVGGYDGEKLVFVSPCENIHGWVNNVAVVHNFTRFRPQIIYCQKILRHQSLPILDYITLNVPPRAFSNVPLQIWSL